jgi:hypothetical protein
MSAWLADVCAPEPSALSFLCNMAADNTPH